LNDFSSHFGLISPSQHQSLNSLTNSLIHEKPARNLQEARHGTIHWIREGQHERPGLVSSDKRTQGSGLRAHFHQQGERSEKSSSMPCGLRSKKKRSDEEKRCWSHTSFLLDLKDGDFMIYVNIPERNQCTIVRVRGPYDYTEVWDPKQFGELQHPVHCQFIGVFERDCVAVHPDLARRLKSKRSHWDLEDIKDLVSSLLSHFR